jgi:chromosome segregation protein
VIFAGSEKRRGAGYAEVTLTMGDLPPETAAKWGTFSDVAVSRKIYSSGEREYYINGRKCRLKDVKDIFFDTGLGARSISIIEQERVTKIVNSSPEELRYFLEETAGVIRYKERRKEAETRLKQTQDNLSRINDIISIMLTDIERLAKQVERLDRYKELKRKKSALEKSFICVTYGRLAKERGQQDEQIATKRKEMAEIVATNQSQIAKETELQQLQAELRDNLKDLRTAYNEARDNLAKAESDIRQHRANIENAGRERVQLEEDISAHERRLTDISARQTHLETAIEEAAELCSEFSESVQEHQESISGYKGTLDRATDEIKSINRKFLDITQKFTDLTNQINLKEAEAANHKATAERLIREKESIQSESSTLQARLEETRASLQRVEAQREALKQNSVEFYERKVSKDAEYNQFKKLCTDIEVELNSTKNRADFLRQEISSKLIPQELSALISQYNGRPYIDLTEKSENDYILYGDLLLFEDSVKEDLINALAQVDISLRFTFRSEIGALSGQELVADNIYRQGAVYRKVSKQDPTLAIMRLEERLQAELSTIDNLNEQYTESSDRLSATAKELEEIEREFTAQNEAIKRLELEYSSMLTNVAHLEEQSGRFTRNIGVVDKEITLALDGQTFATEEAQTLREKREAMSDERQEIDDHRQALEDRIEHFTELLEEAREQYIAASRELGKYSERKLAAHSELGELQKESENALQMKRTLTNRLEGLTEVSIKQWQDELVKAEAVQEEASKGVIVAADAVTTCENQQIALDDELGKLRKSLGDINKELHELDLKIADIHGKLGTTATNMNALKVQMKEIYDEDIEAVWQNYAESGTSKQKVQEEIAYIDVSIEELGALNMAAEEEYANKQQEHAEQIAQSEDIDRAIASLNDLIADIDNSTVQLFEETFIAVRANFTEVFTRFFGSGSADLRLTEPENLMTTGVELFINPPGKRVNNKNLLSGGEKALAALTLLFALFLQKPTPFCFLDEVDAPLDDANAGRFITMVKSMAHETQFVIITHKHQTMAAADSLYGVTMQEGGVSTILSVEIK